MKINKLTSTLIAVGVISLASAVQANTTVYLTGSTAARSIIFNAATTSGQIFSGAATIVSPSPNNTSGANTIVFEGNITGVGTVDLNCSFTGSEAGIAAVAGQGLSQSLPNDPNGPGPYSLPGVPPSYLTPASGYTTTAPLASIPGAPANPDLTMADTSQSVSLTPKSLYPLKDYGVVGIVPFTIMKGYEATPDGSYSDLNNVTTAQLNQNLNGPLVANFYTDNTNDTDNVVICGRNIGSGTRVNGLLNLQYGVGAPVDQFAFNSSYPVATPGVLTFNGSYAAPATLTEIVNDGFDGGSSVAKVLNVDGSGSGVVMLGYLGISDAASAHAPSAGGAAVYLPFNGVYESDSGVINGTYPYWGLEHLLGSVGQSSSSAAGKTGSAIASGIAAQLISSGAGTKTGAVGPSYSAQSVLIPTALMLSTRGTDGGFPSQGTF